MSNWTYNSARQHGGVMNVGGSTHARYVKAGGRCFHRGVDTHRERERPRSEPLGTSMSKKSERRIFFIRNAGAEYTKSVLKLVFFT